MDIKFDLNTGRILACTIEGKIEKTENVMTIADADLPEDFMLMFPLGKYLVHEGKIVDKDAPKQMEDPSKDTIKKESIKTSRPEAKERKRK